MFFSKHCPLIAHYSLGFTFLGLGVTHLVAAVLIYSYILLLDFLLLSNILAKIGSVKVYITLVSEYGTGFSAACCFFYDSQAYLLLTAKGGLEALPPDLVSAIGVRPIAFA